MGTSVLGFVLRSNYKATVLRGMLIVAFAGRLKFINSDAPPSLADCKASLGRGDA